MRKFEREQLLELINTMKTVVDMMESIFASGEKDEFFRILSGQQEAAISIGTKLEQMITPALPKEEENRIRETVQVLELYCELLWNISNTAGYISITEPVQTLREALDEVENKIKGLRVRFEIVFLPYKASMWDCMETVWEAAMADPDCDVYVVPIPYCDLNPDGSASNMYCEMDLMPKKVPVTDFRRYNIEQRRPDVIYIHNPYDEYNKVTSVHPDYYSSKLCNYTDMLVYIPYFLTNGDIPETHVYIPTYDIIDRIVLQSKKMAEKMALYVPEEKLIVLGTPKADRIIQLGKKGKEVIGEKIPSNWKSRIEGKKVILYNVSISGILQNSEAALDKIRYVISTFSDRKDVVLLWRPHPLTEATLKSMRPELYREYMDIKNSFIQENKGILDESADAGVTATICDAYIGEDTSSLMHYFGLNGKPILFTDWNVTKELSEEERRTLFFTDCFFENESAWFVPRSSLGYNYLCNMDLKTGKVKMRIELTGEHNNPKKGNAYFGICKLENKILLSPVWSNDIYIYDLKQEQAIKIPLRDYGRTANFAKAYAYKDKFILQPRNYPAVVIVDPKTFVCEYYEVPDIEVRREYPDFLFGIGSCLTGGKLYIPCVYRNSFMAFDVETGEYEEYFVDESDTGFYSLTVIDGCVWMIGNGKAEVVVKNLASGEINVWRGFPNDFQAGKQPFREIVNAGEEVFVFPENANMTIIINKMTGEVKEGRRNLSDCLSGTNYWMVKQYGNKIMALSAHDRGMYEYDAETKNELLKTCMWEKQDLDRLEAEEWNLFFDNKRVPNGVMENDRWSVGSFLDFVVGNRYNGYQNAQKNYIGAGIDLSGKCGEKIHFTIKSIIKD